MTGEKWLQALAAELGVPVPTEQETTDLLALASTAAHTSSASPRRFRAGWPPGPVITAAEALAVATRLAEEIGDRD